MKRSLFLSFFLVFLGILFISTSASAFILNLSNWKFNPNAVDNSLTSTISPIDEMSFLGGTFINQDGVGGPGAAFTDQGFFNGEAFQNDNVTLSSTSTGLNSTYQITGVFDSSGVNTTLAGTDQNFVFNSGGTLDLYLDTNFNYGTGDSSDGTAYGADDGTKIASFTLMSGAGDFDFNPNELDGNIDIEWQATYLLSNVWFNEDGTDLSTLVALNEVGAFTDSNNNAFSTVPANLASEIAENFTNGTPDSSGDFYTSNNGSFNPTAIPEPATLFLLGIGLLGLAGVSRKKA